MKRAPRSERLGGPTRAGAALYAAMAALAVLIASWRRTSLVWFPTYEQPGTWGLDARAAVVASSLAGAGLALATVLGTEWLLRRARWAQALRAEFRQALSEASDASVLVLALASGTCEELLFRGALQPWLGVVATSVLFGAVHVVPRRELLPWTLWAGAMGAVLGLLYEATGSLAGPVLAHVAINAVNLRRIVRFDPTLDPPAPPPPSLTKRTRTRTR